MKTWTRTAKVMLVGSVAATGCSDDGPGFPCSDEPGAACTYAGVPGPAGASNETAHRQATHLSQPIDVTFAPDGRAWIIDWNNHRVRRVDFNDDLVTMIGNENESDGTCDRPDLAAECDNRDFLPFGNPVGAPGPEVSLNHPTEIDFFPNGDAILTAWHNNKLRYWESATGLVKVIAGDDYGYVGVGGPAYMAEFNLPKASVIDPSGRIYVVDSRNQKVRILDANTDRTISSVLGVGTAGYSGDGGMAIDAEISLDKTGTRPEGGLALDSQYLYLADSGNHRIRRMELATGMIDCIAGDGGLTAQGDGGSALTASLGRPLDIELGPDGRLWIADATAYSIRAIDLDTGIIERVVGTGETCTGVCLEAEEGLPKDQVRLNKPSGITFDADGNLYIADQYNNRIVRIARDW
jgi:DNA-binding beta-propeller fold protein YncE